MRRVKVKSLNVVDYSKDDLVRRFRIVESSMLRWYSTRGSSHRFVNRRGIGKRGERGNSVGHGVAIASCGYDICDQILLQLRDCTAERVRSYLSELVKMGNETVCYKDLTSLGKPKEVRWHVVRWV